jgi:hypothetical protein
MSITQQPWWYDVTEEFIFMVDYGQNQYLAMWLG